MMPAACGPLRGATSDAADRAAQHRVRIALLLPVVGYVPGDFELLAYLHHRVASAAARDAGASARCPLESMSS